jgi:aminomethyltransferase
VYGSGAAQLLQRAGFPDVALPLHHWHQVTLENVDLYLHRTDPVLGDGYFVMCAREDQDAAREQLLSAGAELVSAEIFDALRIISGQPRFGAEITPTYIPLETGLWDDVSFSKGCYIGQEIIARMESRGRLAKKLVHFQCDAPVAVGADIISADKRVGTITSAAAGYALGYVKNSALENEVFSTANAVLTPL